MPSSIIDNDVDTIEYEFAAQGSLHYGLLMLAQAREWKSLAIMEGRPATMAKADALARHAKDYVRGASSMVSLLIQSFSDDTDSMPTWQAIRRRALDALYEANELRHEMDVWAEKFAPDLSEYTARCNVQWMALLSDRSFYTKEV